MDLPNKSDNPEAKQPKKVIQPVVSGAHTAKRPATRRFKDYLMAESPKDLAKKVGHDVLVPRAKAGFEEAVRSFLSGMLWGDSTVRPLDNMVRGTVLRGNNTNYNAISSAQPSGLTQARQATGQNTGAYQDIVCPTQERAEILLAGMYTLLNQYRVVAVGDLYELAGLPTPISSNAYGWMSLDGARISKTRDGFLLELPRPSLI